MSCFKATSVAGRIATPLPSARCHCCWKKLRQFAVQLSQFSPMEPSSANVITFGTFVQSSNTLSQEMSTNMLLRWLQDSTNVDHLKILELNSANFWSISQNQKTKALRDTEHPIKPAGPPSSSLVGKHGKPAGQPVLILPLRCLSIP